MPSKLLDYDILGEIGSGSYGTCKKIRRRIDNKVQFQHGRRSCNNLLLQCYLFVLHGLVYSPKISSRSEERTVVEILCCVFFASN